jgi:hypothetical protein
MERLTPNSEGSRDRYESLCASSSGYFLPLTVILTTEEGTAAALNAARWLGKDLEGQVTLLVFEVAQFQLPLDQPPLILDCATEQEFSLVSHKCAGKEKDVAIKICLCRDRDTDLQRVFRRRSLVVIGGKRRWWLSREERLEKALQRLGHHVIFIDVDQNRRAGSRMARFSPLLTAKTASLNGNQKLRNEKIGSRTI